jgi:hypothetical protein
VSSVDPKELAPVSEGREGRKVRSAETLRKSVRDLAESLGPRDLDTLVAFAEFLKARRAARSFAHHVETQQDASGEPVPESRADPTTKVASPPPAQSEPGP